MKIIKVKRKSNFDYKPFIKRHATSRDCSTLIREDCRIIDEDTGKTLVVYFKLKEKFPKLLNACKHIQFRKETRTGGLKTNSAVFGFEPRKTMRKDYCSTTAMVKNNPRAFLALTDFGKVLNDYYAEYIPDIFKKHIQITEEKIKKEWKMTDTPFTSGIVNYNNYLKYHFDSGNFDSVYSNMIVLKKDVEGGWLSIPEFDLNLECADHTVVMFDGQKIMHGVTEIKYLNKNAYRYSIVYYSLQQMWNCQTIDEELLRIREIKLVREMKRLKINKEANNSTEGLFPVRVEHSTLV